MLAMSACKQPGQATGMLTGKTCFSWAHRPVLISDAGENYIAFH